MKPTCLNYGQILEERLEGVHDHSIRSAETRVGFNQHALRGIRACVRSRVTADTCTPETRVESAIRDFGDELFGPVVREKWRINY